MVYDYIVIGGGPSGLAFAQTITTAANNSKVLLLEAYSMLGGCHVVERRQGFFTEHGPRMYSNRFKSFNNLLLDMETSFEELFVETKSNSLYTLLIKRFRLYEMFAVIIVFLIILIIPNFGKCTSVLEFCNKWYFSKESIDLIDQLCKGTDGADITKYSLNTFIDLITQHLGYNFYQPKYPNDLSLFKIWEKTLLQRGVDIVYNTRIESIKENTVYKNKRAANIDTMVYKNLSGSTNTVYTSNGTTFTGKHIIFAIPPMQLQKILKKSNMSTFKRSFIKDTDYIRYLCITFHWNKKFKLKTENGIVTGTLWDLVYAPISEYTNESKSKTLLSIAITSFHKKGTLVKKLPNDCTLQELFDEVYFQLNPHFEFPKKPDNSFKSNLYRPAFVKTSNSNFIPFEIEKSNNLYTLGTQNGKSNYPFTTIESAVQNGITLANELMSSTSKFKDNTILGFNFIRLILILFLLLWLGVKKVY
jgi:hypothetical protein